MEYCIVWSVLFFFPFQFFLVQCILAAEGNVSIAIFLYEEPGRVNDTENYQVGFDSGDGQRYHVILHDMQTNPEILLDKYIFRIDGMYVGCISDAESANPY